MEWLGLLAIPLQIYSIYHWYLLGKRKGAEEAYERTKQIMSDYRKQSDRSLTKAFADHFKEHKHERVN